MAKKKKELNKTAFVLKHGKLSAAEIVKKAKGLGATLTENYIYNIRSKAKSGSSGKRKTVSKVNGSVKKRKKNHATESNQEELFATIALDLGLGKAERLLQGIKEAAVTAATSSN